MTLFLFFWLILGLVGAVGLCKTLDRAFISFPNFLLECNLNREAGMYYYWRLKPGSGDEMIVTKIKLEDLEEINIFKTL